ncbi:hypothetical protein BDP27DRAFT_1424617 [Rhodocollybia butyracea]|uniref:Uncharacterized protein n=1 Tax=Rhodocollybia butyracea TaxID=206335 RepID=A0A9P5PH82_9AGAR|nr:hypothetical protein BDP27DRAFT_1424617 [Rhodocollybia butyracea]
MKSLKQRVSSPALASPARPRHSLPARNLPRNITADSSPFVSGPLRVIQPEDLIPIKPHPMPMTSPRTSRRLSVIDTLLEGFESSEDEPVNWEELKRGYSGSQSDSEVEFAEGPVLKKRKRPESRSHMSSSRTYTSSSPSHSRRTCKSSYVPSRSLVSSSDDEVEFIGFKFA